MSVPSLLEHVGLDLKGRTIHVDSRQVDPPRQGPAMPAQLSLAAVESLVKRHPWTPPGLASFAHGTVQAFDQSLSNTGVALVKSNESGIHLLATAMIRPPADVQALKSTEGNYARADSLYAGLLRARTGMAANVDGIAYERPPVKGMRVDSIVLAGREVHRATHGRAVLVDNRHAKAVIVGRAGTKADPVTKAHVKEAVERYVTPPAERGLVMPWNEHVRDAVMLALTWLYDEKIRQQQAAALAVEAAA
ncbi:hypothetical protein [Streptomyces albidoflavus]|uniref:hypothetical protein n=1 Tax=Streptomyces albidoflavus TaxID=1886 RepID=UPI0033D70BCC